MMANSDEYPAGWLTQFRRGAVGGVLLFVLAVVLTAIPTFLAWLAPGADSTSAGRALKAAMVVAISGNQGGVVLNGTSVSLSPLLVSLLLGWLVVGQARGQDTAIGFAGLVTGYTVATAMAAHWSQLGATRVPVASSAVAACCFVLLVGGAARFGPAYWNRLAERWRQVGKAAAGICAVYVLAAALLAAGVLATHLHEAARLQGVLAGGAAGLPVALLGIAATPNAVLSGVGYLTGPGFEVGSHTSVSMFAVVHGQLPVFPLLAGVPSGRPATALGAAVGVLTALVAGWLAVRLVSGSARPSDRPVADVGIDVLLAALGAGVMLAGLSALAAGGVGSGSLSHVGATGWQVGAAIVALASAASAIWVGIDRLRHRAAGVQASVEGPPAPRLRQVPGPAPSESSGRDDGSGPDREERRLRSTG
jgi:hypothetical protein